MKGIMKIYLITYDDKEATMVYVLAESMAEAIKKWRAADDDRSGDEEPDNIAIVAQGSEVIV